MVFEQGTLTGFESGDNSITMVALIPELQSDELVQQQIDVYVSNGRQIRKLKEELLNMDRLRWILYFGGGDK